MPKQKHYGPYLIKRSPRFAAGKLTHRGTYVIADVVDGETQRINTGCGFGTAEEAAVAAAEAEIKLFEYKTKKYAQQAGQNLVNVEAEFVKIGDLVLFYLVEHQEMIAAKTKARRREYLGQVERITAFWGERRVSEVNRKNSLAYQKGKSRSVVRNELIILRAIINFGAAEGKLKKYDGQLNFMIPDINARMHAYTVDELIALYKAAMRKRHTWHGKKTYRMSAHIAKFLLVAVLTGTRAERIGEASFVQESGRPWIDLESGIFYREADGEFAPDNKRADPVLVPARLLRLMRKWHRGSGKTPGCRYLIEYQGRPVDCRKGFYTLKHAVLDKTRVKKLNRHSFKHTAVTILLRLGISFADVATYVSTTEKVVREIYNHLVPGEFSPVHRALDAKQPLRPRPGVSAKPQLKVVGGLEANG